MLDEMQEPAVGRVYDMYETRAVGHVLAKAVRRQERHGEGLPIASKEAWEPIMISVAREIRTTTNEELATRFLMTRKSTGLHRALNRGTFDEALQIAGLTHEQTQKLKDSPAPERSSTRNGYEYRKKAFVESEYKELWGKLERKRQRRNELARERGEREGRQDGAASRPAGDQPARGKRKASQGANYRDEDPEDSDTDEDQSVSGNLGHPGPLAPVGDEQTARRAARSETLPPRGDSPDVEFQAARGSASSSSSERHPPERSEANGGTAAHPTRFEARRERSGMASPNSSASDQPEDDDGGDYVVMRAAQAAPPIRFHCPHCSRGIRAELILREDREHRPRKRSRPAIGQRRPDHGRREHRS